MEMKAFLRANWDRVAACALIVLGALALVLGWLGVSRTGLAAEQNPYLISGGLAGIAFVAIGCTMWLSSDLQDEWRRLDALEEHLSTLRSMQVSARVDGNASVSHGISAGVTHSSRSFSGHAVSVPPTTFARYTMITGAPGYEYTLCRPVSSTFSPVSSKVSRMAASVTLSPKSTKPPGKVHSPRPGLMERRVRRMRPSCSGMVPATTFGLR